MENGKHVFLGILITVIILAGCVFAYWYFTKDQKVEEAKKEEEEVISTEPIYTLDNFPKVDASTATQPLVLAEIKNLTGNEPDVSKLNFSKTHQAYEKLIKDEVDLIVVTQPSAEELEMAKKAGMELEVIPVVREGFVFFTNAKNKVDNLTIEQVQNIYTGDIKNWSEVGGENQEILAYQRPTNSGSQTGMLSLVMKDKKIQEAVKDNLISTMQAIVNLVASYDNNKMSIGYSYYYYATTMYQDIDKEVTKNIKFFKINGVEPNESTIKNGTYPFTTSYYIVINKADDENSAARKLANTLLSPRGQKAAKEAGYVPVK
ncbi:MAG: extracellular solute-binding protein [Clostridia bacterium]|nr:extracellular solute-binding protein [Clostridia bacterium]